MDVLRVELDKRADAAKAQPRNRGFAGSLGKVRGDLIDPVGSMSGMDREHFEAFLADAECPTGRRGDTKYHRLADSQCADRRQDQESRVRRQQHAALQT